MKQKELIELISTRMATDVKLKGKEYLFKVCYFCGNPNWNFQVNFEKNAVHCWACDWGGSVAKLCRVLKIPYEGKMSLAAGSERQVITEAGLPEGVVEIDEAGEDEKRKIWRYLKARGVSRDDVKRFNIKWWRPKGRIIFVFYDAFGEVMFWTARTIYKGVKPKYLHATATKKDKLFIWWGEEREEIWIVEGVFDGMRLNKTGKSVIMLFGSSLTDNLIAFLRLNRKKAVICLDFDMREKQLRYERVLKRYLGKDKVRSFWVEGKDVAEAGLKGRFG